MVNYGSINDAVRGRIKFTPFPHLVDFAQLLLIYDLLLFLKARQVCFTWFVSHYAIWRSLLQEGSKGLVLSKSEDAASEVISYARFIYSKLPSPLQVPLGKDQSGLLTFPVMGSQIRALASTETAGIGFGDASYVILDEFAFHPYARENYAEIKPMIDAGQGRKLIIGSAPNKLASDTKFNELWFCAKEGTNNFVPKFWSYNVMPYRNKEWFEQQRREYDTLELVTRYPKTEEEALSSTRDLCRFDTDAVNELIADARSWKPLEERANGIVKIYKRPVAGEKYVFAIDPSEGGYDPSVGILFDWRTNEEVAEYHGNISVDEQARISWELYKEYNEAYCAPERNADGRRLIEKLLGYGVQNFYYETKDVRKEKPGWWTSGVSRPVLIGDLAEMIFKRNVRIHNPLALSQFLTFIRTQRKPEGEATRGANDDYVMAIGIAEQIRKQMPVGKIQVTSFKYRG